MGTREGAREENLLNAIRAAGNARVQSHTARCTWYLELAPGKTAKIIIEGDFDDEVIDAMQDYLGRQKQRLVNARADAQTAAGAASQ